MPEDLAYCRRGRSIGLWQPGHAGAVLGRVTKPSICVRQWRSYELLEEEADLMNDLVSFTTLFSEVQFLNCHRRFKRIVRKYLVLQEMNSIGNLITV